MNRAAAQRDFAAAVLQTERPVPVGLGVQTGVDLARRFQVHRNNAIGGLLDALARRFPACRRLVGDDFFSAMAADFVRLSPPRSPMLAQYGDRFDAFVAAFPPAAGLPYLADVARLENAIAGAYHAADAAPIAIAVLNEVPAGSMADVSLALHPAVRLVRSRWAIVSIWRTNTFDREVLPVEADLAEDAIVSRPHLQVEVRTLRPGGAAFVEALARRACLAEAGAGADPRFDLAAILRQVFDAGAIAGLNAQSPQ